MHPHAPAAGRRSKTLNEPRRSRCEAGKGPESALSDGEVRSPIWQELPHSGH
jgi:hypothetical protein